MSEDAFESFFADVKPLAKSDTIPTYHRQLAKEQAEARQQAATNGDHSHSTVLSREQEIEWIAPLDFMSFQRPGVQHGVFRKLRLGQYECQERLDLHRHTVLQAQQAIVRFIDQCQQHQVRTALIIHGMGHKSKPQALLKSCVNTWLPQIPQVMAFHTCQKHDGGLGAIYVLLAKSAAAKQQNRERFGKRGV